MLRRVRASVTTRDARWVATKVEAARRRLGGAHGRRRGADPGREIDDGARRRDGTAAIDAAAVVPIAEEAAAATDADAGPRPSTRRTAKTTIAVADRRGITAATAATAAGAAPPARPVAEAGATIPGTRSFARRRSIIRTSAG